MLSQSLSAALSGVHALPVEVEVNSGEEGELRLVLVGLPDTAVKESQDRVYSALSNAQCQLPHTRTTINLAPGTLRKEGPLYDLPIALGILEATRQLPQHCLQPYLIAGELSLSGHTRSIRGALAIAQLAKNSGKKAVLLPSVNCAEASLLSGIDILPIDSLQQAVRFLAGQESITPHPAHNWQHQDSSSTSAPDFAEVKGQHTLKRAVEVAIAGNHNLIIIGPPGSGKSMIAKRIPSILPRPQESELLEILQIHSAAGIDYLQKYGPQRRPFRSPHHTISDVGLLGGGSIPKPGELSLAHHGVLFLDELPEFRRNTLEVLRQPLEDQSVTISRSAGTVTIPAAVTLVAAMNPTPDGRSGQQKSRSSQAQIQRYRAKLSAPLLDRIDIHTEAPALSVEELSQKPQGESSASIRKRVTQARQRQNQRFAHTPITTNAQMSHRHLEEYCALSPRQIGLLQEALRKLELSARAYDRIRKVSRTIADLADSEHISDAHLMEAIQYRSLDRQYF